MGGGWVYYLASCPIFVGLKMSPWSFLYFCIIPSFYYYYTDTEIHLRGIFWCFNLCMHCIQVRINIPILKYFFVMETFKILSTSVRTYVHTAVINTGRHASAQLHITCSNNNSVLSGHSSSSLFPSSSQPLGATILLGPPVTSYFLFSTCKWDHAILILMCCLAYFI